MITSHQLQNVLNDEIPITHALGIKVEEVANNFIILSAPLSNNINHKSTVFGGSLYSVAVLSGWAMIYSLLDTLGIHAHIVIHESKIEYLKPVSQDFRVRCEIEDLTEVDKKLAMFERKGISRIQLTARVLNGERPAVKFIGWYVIHR